jgi:hypothetical protein
MVLGMGKRKIRTNDNAKKKKGFFTVFSIKRQKIKMLISWTRTAASPAGAISGCLGKFTREEESANERWEAALFLPVERRKEKAFQCADPEAEGERRRSLYPI